MDHLVWKEIAFLLSFSDLISILNSWWSGYNMTGISLRSACKIMLANYTDPEVRNP